MEKIDHIFDLMNQPKASNHLGVGAIKSYKILEVHERPYSHVARCAVSGTAGKKKIFIKMYKPYRLGKKKDYSEKIIREFKTTLFWYKKLQEIEGVGTIKPLYYFPQDQVIITEETSGIRLIDRIREVRFFPTSRKIGMLSRVLENTGNWIKTFQQVGGIHSERFNAGDLIADIDLRLRRLVDYKGLNFTNDSRHHILSHLHKMARKIKPEEFKITYLHQDFALSNILISRGEIVLLDFNDIRKGSVYFDVSRLFHQLEMLNFQPGYYRPTVRSMQWAFLKGYGNPDLADSYLFRMFLIRHSITQVIKLARYSKFSLPVQLKNRWMVFRHFRLINSIIKERFRL